MPNLTAQLCLVADFRTGAIPEFMKLTSKEEHTLWDHFHRKIHGKQEQEVQTLFKGKLWNPALPEPGGGPDAHGSLLKAEQAAITAYNALGTGVAFKLQEPASCVRYEFRDGTWEKVVNNPLSYSDAISAGSFTEDALPDAVRVKLGIQAKVEVGYLLVARYAVPPG